MGLHNDTIVYYLLKIGLHIFDIWPSTNGTILPVETTSVQTLTLFFSHTKYGGSIEK